MRSLAIVNPASNGGRTGSRLASVLEAVGPFVDGYVVSAKPGDAVALATKARDYECLVAVGGDGTVCEVVRGMDLQNQVLAIVPTGTGNSLGRDLGMRNLQSAAVCLRTITVQPLDTMEIRFRTADGSEAQWHGCSMVTIGYASRVTDYVNRHLKFLGKASYALAASLLAGSGDRFTAELTYDSERSEVRSITGLMVGNTRHVANFEVFPQASFNDGCLEVVELNAGFFGQNVHNLSLLLHREYKNVRNGRIRQRLTVNPHAPQKLMIDGEVITNVVWAEIQVRKHGVRLCSPA